MPEIKVQYTSGRLRESDIIAVKALLKREAPIRFAVPGRELTAESFSIYVKAVKPPSEQSHDVIVRFVLHRDISRLESADTNANELAALIDEMLNGKSQQSLTATDKLTISIFASLLSQPPQRLTVGVSLVFTEISWASA
jgi:hypothetical protein